MTEVFPQAQPLTTTLLIPDAVPLGLPMSLDITAFPTNLFGIVDQSIDVLTHELGLEPVAAISSVNAIGPAIYSLLNTQIYNLPLSEVSYFGGQHQFNVLASSWASGGSFPVGVQDFAEYVAFGETALVEESPPRRTSPAAIAASRLSSRVILAGAPTSAVVAHINGSPVMLIVGASITLVLGTAGAGLTLATHWLARKLEI